MCVPLSLEFHFNILATMNNKNHGRVEKFKKLLVLCERLHMLYILR